eukprot:1301257-Pyramimonas_sp.AAC.1
MRLLLHKRVLPIFALFGQPPSGHQRRFAVHPNPPIRIRAHAVAQKTPKGPCVTRCPVDSLRTTARHVSLTEWACSQSIMHALSAWGGSWAVQPGTRDQCCP